MWRYRCFSISTCYQNTEGKWARKNINNLKRIKFLFFTIRGDVAYGVEKRESVTKKPRNTYKGADGRGDWGEKEQYSSRYNKIIMMY